MTEYLPWFANQASSAGATVAFAVPRHPRDERLCGRGFLFTASARVGFRLLLERTWTAGRGRILLPAYVGLSPLEGSGVFDPVQTVGVPAGFYAVRDDLSVDMDSLELALGTKRTFAVLLVHYFGFPQPDLHRVRDLCRERGALLIEDCAHCLHGGIPDASLGGTGDFALYSFHKVLSSAGGGALKVNGPVPLASSLQPTVSDSIDLADLAAVANADLTAIGERRRANYLALAASVAHFGGVRLLHSSLPPQVVPMNLPVLIEARDRFEVYKAMRAEGVGVIACYHTLITPITAREHPVSLRLSGQILNLPVHQDVLPGQRPLVLAALRAALR